MLPRCNAGTEYSNIKVLEAALVKKYKYAIYPQATFFTFCPESPKITKTAHKPHFYNTVNNLKYFIGRLHFIWQPFTCKFRRAPYSFCFYI